MCIFCCWKLLCKKKLAFPLHNQYPQFQYSPERLSLLPLPLLLLVSLSVSMNPPVHFRCSLSCSTRLRQNPIFISPKCTLVCLWKSMPSSWPLRQWAIRIFFTSFFMQVTDCLPVGFLPYLVWELLRNCLPHRQRVYVLSLPLSLNWFLPCLGSWEI